MAKVILTYATVIIAVLNCLSCSGEAQNGVRENRADAEKRLHSMSTELLTQLANNREIYNQLSVENRQRYNDLYEKIRSHERRDELLAVLRRYDRWLNTIDEAERAKLLDLPAAERIERIQTIKERQVIERFGKAGPTKMPEQDAQAVYIWVVGLLKRQATDISFAFYRLDPEVISNETLQKLSKTAQKNPEIVDLFAGEMLLAVGNASHEQLKFIIDDGNYEGSEVEILKSVVSEEAREIIESQQSEERIQLLFNWIEVALQSSSQKPEARAARLKNYFENEMDEDERSSLDLYPPKQRKSEINKRFRKSLDPRHR